MKCSVHKGQIRGKAHRWNNRWMCSRCFAYFTSHVRVARPPQPRPQKMRHPQPPARPSGGDTPLVRLLRSLFGE